MKKIILILFILSVLTNCNETEPDGDPISTTYYFNFVYDSVNVFSYENYHLDSLIVLVSYDQGTSYFSDRTIDSIFYEDESYQMNGSFLVDYGNGDIDTILSRWNDHEFLVFFNDQVVFSAKNEQEEWDFINSNQQTPSRNWKPHTYIFQCEKKSLIPAEN